MINPFSLKNAHTDEEYKKILRRQLKLYLGLFVLSILMIAIYLFTSFVLKKSVLYLDRYAFTVGIPIAMVSLKSFINHRRLLEDPDLLKATRIESTDERLLEVRSKAITATFYTLLAATFLAYFVIGNFFPEYSSFFAWIMLSIYVLYIVTYNIAIWFYNKKM